MTNGALLLLLLVLLVATDAQMQNGHRRAGRRSDSGATAATTHLDFYFHDAVSSRLPTAVWVVSPLDASSMSMFGMVNVMDDPLTEGPEPGEGPVGRAQGLYMGSDQARLGFLQAMTLVLVGFLQAMTLVFTAGEYNGSTLMVLGRNCPLDDVREPPVVGGTGTFRFATGYALLHTHWLDFSTGDATVEYNVYITH